MGFELCYLADMPAVLRALAGAEKSIENWWQQLEPTKKHPEGSGKVINALGDGGQLRSRSHAVSGGPAAGHVRHLRDTSRARTARRAALSPREAAKRARAAPAMKGASFGAATSRLRRCARKRVSMDFPFGPPVLACSSINSGPLG
jgi:hypothetical protein